MSSEVKKRDTKALTKREMAIERIQKEVKEQKKVPDMLQQIGAKIKQGKQEIDSELVSEEEEDS